jgi:flavin-dependent dehydrogenase
VEPEYDVVIVGARVAGASLGLLLARAGRRVLLLDREEFSSDTLSTHYVHPFSIPILGRLGVLKDLLAAGFREIRRVRTAIGDCVFEGPIAPGGGFGLAPRRNVLDSLLQEQAVRHGAELWTRTAAEGMLVEDGAARGVRAGGRDVRARVVVGADGKASKVAAWIGTESYREVPPLRPAYYGYYQGVAPLPGDGSRALLRRRRDRLPLSTKALPANLGAVLPRRRSSSSAEGSGIRTNSSVASYRGSSCSSRCAW